MPVSTYITSRNRLLLVILSVERSSSRKGNEILLMFSLAEFLQVNNSIYQIRLRGNWLNRNRRCSGTTEYCCPDLPHANTKHHHSNCRYETCDGSPKKSLSGCSDYHWNSFHTILIPIPINCRPCHRYHSEPAPALYTGIFGMWIPFSGFEVVL